MTNIQLICVPECKLSENLLKNQSHGTCFSQWNLHSNIGLALHICFVLCDTLLHGEHPLCAVHTSTIMEKPFANHTVDLRRVGRLTLVGNSMGFVSKRSTLSAVKCIQMLKIGRFRGEPTLLCLALWALHPLNEVLAHLCFLIASATICQHTGFSMGSQHRIRGLLSPLSLHVSPHRGTVLLYLRQQCAARSR